jgi:antitoxin ParD1/3/4
MHIVIKPEQEKFILEKLQQGKYKNVDDLLTVAFQLLDQHDEREKQLIELRQKIVEGTQQIHEGKVVDGELVFQQLQEKLNSMEER